MSAKPFFFPIKVLPDDIDFMGHVNNARYLNWVQDTRPVNLTPGVPFNVGIQISDSKLPNPLVSSHELLLTPPC